MRMPTKDNKAATKQVYEQLLDVDFNLAIVPQLALAWKPLNPTTWEFELRPDVTFHDGTPFTADDVVFSIERARAKTSDFRPYVDGITAVETLDDHTVRITTAGPDPSLWLKLADVAIMSRTWAEQHGVTKPADYLGHMRRPTPRATPTAPGRSCSNRSSRAAAGSWSAIPPGGARRSTRTTSTASFTCGRKAMPERAALLEGEIDLLRTPPYSAMDQIRGTTGLKLAHRPKLLTMFFGLDQGSAELRSSNVKDKNPFKDKRVRQAMADAIDFEPILA